MVRAEDHIRPHGGGCREHQDPHSSLRPLQHRRLPRPLPGILSSGWRPRPENLVRVFLQKLPFKLSTSNTWENSRSRCMNCTHVHKIHVFNILEKIFQLAPKPRVQPLSSCLKENHLKHGPFEENPTNNEWLNKAQSPGEGDSLVVPPGAELLDPPNLHVRIVDSR